MSSSSSSSSVASCQPPPISSTAAAAREARERSGGGGGGGRDVSDGGLIFPPPLDMEAIAGGKDGTNTSKAEVIDRARAELEAKFGNVHATHPCGSQLKDWQMCILDEAAKDDGDTKGLRREEVAAKQVQIHRRCADPFLFSLMVCRKDEQKRQEAKIIADVGHDKYRAMREDREQKLMAERGYAFMKRMEQAEARTDALAEAFRQREGMAPPVELPRSPKEEKKWYEIWKDDDGGKEGAGASDDPFVTDEQLRRKEEIRAEADSILSSMRQAREEKEAESMATVESATGSNESGEGGKPWWRFGL